jgi:hypothetical protein
MMCVVHEFRPILSVMFNTVNIEIPCSSNYEAQVLFDDFKAMLEAGQTIEIIPKKTRQR